MVNKVPDRINIRKSDRKDYKLLQEQDPFKGRTNKEVFIMAMVIGFREGNKIGFRKGEKDGFFLLKDLNDKEKSIFYAIAVAEEEDLNVLLDKNKVYSITEEYANAGIKLLKNKVFSRDPGSYIKKLEAELLEKYNEIKGKIPSE